jgi:hypothetical protein
MKHLIYGIQLVFLIYNVFGHPGFNYCVQFLWIYITHSERKDMIDQSVHEYGSYRRKEATMKMEAC